MELDLFPEEEYFVVDSVVCTKVKGKVRPVVSVLSWAEAAGLNQSKLANEIKEFLNNRNKKENG